MGNSLPESLLLGIPEASHLRAHTIFKNRVDAFDHLRPGTEIVTQKDLSSLPRPGRVGGRIVPVFFQKNPRVCQAELVDGLFHIPNQEAILFFTAECIENRVLDTVGILIFIHHDLPKTLPDLHCRRSDPAAVFAQQKIQHPVLQVAKIKDSTAPFHRLIPSGELPNQRHQPPGPIRGLLQILQNLAGGIGETPQLAFHTLPAGISHRFDPFRQLQIHILSGENQPPVVQILPLHNLVPGTASPQGLQLAQGLRQVSRSLCQFRILSQLTGAGLHHRKLHIQVGE